MGTLQAGAGTLGVLGSAGLCTTGVGCAAGAVTGTVSADYAQAGARQAFTGNATQPYGEQVLQTLGLSPQAAAYTYAALGMAPAAVEGLVLRKAVNAEAAANAAAKLSYEPIQKFGANGGTGSIANVRAISAEEANAPFVARGWNPPYDAGSQVRTFTTTSEVGFVRVSTADNPQGAFLVRADEVAGMTPQQIQQYLALPKVPTQISDVVVPAGTKTQVGQVAAQPSFGVASKGGTQYQLLNPIPNSSFGTPRPIK